MESQIVNYQGSRTFQYLSDISNFPIDQVNYLLAQVAALGLAFFFKNFLCHEAISTNTRHMFSMICGIFLAYFCFGYQVYHMFIQASLAYIIVKSTSPVESHRFVMLFAFMYLSAMHLMRQFYTYGLYTLDITGPMMILTQKVSAFAFNVHDGVATPPEKLTVDQKRLAIRRMPELLEYFSYIFSFQAILSGPLIPYAEFVDYMNGSFYNKASKNNNYSALKERRFNEYSWCDVPSPNQVVAYKLITSLSFLCSVYFVQMVWPATFITSDEFLDRSLWWIMGYLIIHTTTLRFKYYLGWLLSDAICNASGFGFNGYDCNNKPLWNGVSNVDVIGFEFGENMRGCLLSWNTTTQLWLKRYAYERVTNKKYKTLYTFLLSALWHGFYPGYYLMFLTAAVFTECARIVRRHVRPLFQSYSASSRLYDVTTIVTTRIFMSYMTFPFDVLHFVPSIRIYMRLYFCLHLLAVVAYLALPVLLPLKYRSVSKSSNQPVAANDNFVDRENKIADRFTKMKVKVISRNPDDYIRETKKDIHKIPRNYDPKLHPFEVCREYTRALNATKLERVFAKPFIGSLEGHQDGVQIMKKHPTSLSSLLSGSCDGEIKEWNLAERKCKRTIQAHSGLIRGVTYQPDGSSFYTVGDDKVIKQWNSCHPAYGEEDEPCNTVISKHMLTGIDHHYKNQQFVTCGEKVELWDEHRSEPLKAYSWGVDTLNCIRFNPVEVDVLGCCATNRSIILFDIREASPLRKIILNLASNALCWNPMEAFVFTVANEDYNLYSFDMRKLKTPINVHKDHVDAVIDLDYSPTGKEFVSGSYDKTIRIFQTEKGHSRDVYHTKRMQRLTSVCWSLDNKYILTGSDEMNIRIWKSHASEKIGMLMPRQKAAMQYNDKLKEKFGNHPKLKRISRHRHVPKHIHNSKKELHAIRESQKRKEENRRLHSKPGSVPHVAERAKHTVKEDV